MNFKQIIQDYFTFSRNERKGITVLLIILFLLAVANKIIFYFETPGEIDKAMLDSASYDMNLLSDTINRTGKKLFLFDPNTIDSEALDSLLLPKGIKQNLLKFREKGGRFYSKTDFRKIYGIKDTLYNQIESYLIIENRKTQLILNKTPEKLFCFDPNNSSDEDFVKLGLSEKQIHTIRNYQANGGSFREKADFLKIYGITESQKKDLADYILIEKKGITKSEKFEKVNVERIEINSADSVELMNLPGIGDKLSKRIVKYRDLLGGFYSLNQLKEVYGLNEQTIPKITDMVRIDTTRIHKVDLNFTEWYELAKHPYIQKNRAKQIVKFRTKYGSIQNPVVLRDSMILNIEEYSRLKPYF